jgi:hypothetical protein
MAGNASMNISTARIFTGMLAGLAASFLSTLMGVARIAYPKAFNEEALRTKCAVGFMLSLGWIIRMIFWGTFSWPHAALALVIGPIAGGVLLTSAHFIGEIIWAGITDLYSIAASFVTGLTARFQHANAL